MKTVHELIQIANKCLDKPDEATLTPRMNFVMLHEHLDNEEIKRLIALMSEGSALFNGNPLGVKVDDLISEEETAAIQADVATMVGTETIINYRGRFYRLETKASLTGTGASITFMYDDQGGLHSMVSEGKVLYTKER